MIYNYFFKKQKSVLYTMEYFKIICLFNQHPPPTMFYVWLTSERLILYVLDFKIANMYSTKLSALKLKNIIYSFSVFLTLGSRHRDR